MYVYEEKVFDDKSDDPILYGWMGSEGCHYPATVSEWSWLRRYGAVRFPMYGWSQQW